MKFATDSRTDRPDLTPDSRVPEEHAAFDLGSLEVQRDPAWVGQNRASRLSSPIVAPNARTSPVAVMFPRNAPPLISALSSVSEEMTHW